MENKLTYTQNGDYLIPDLKLTEEPEAAPLGKYGRMRRQYLKEHRPILFQKLVLEGKLYPHLREIDETAHPASVEMMPHDGEGGGRDGDVEAVDPMKWAGPDEHPESAGGGDHPERAGVQLTGQEQQLTLFPSEQEQRQFICGSGERGNALRFFHLRRGVGRGAARGSGNLDGKLRIYALFLGMPDTRATIAFLKQEYGSFYSHSQTYQDGSHGTVIYTTKDIEFRRYQPAGPYTPRNRAAALLKELASAQDYFTPVEQGRWDAIVRGFQQRGEPLPPPVPRAPLSASRAAGAAYPGRAHHAARR